MMDRLLSVSVMVGLLLLLAPAVHAQDDDADAPDFAREGTYVGIGATYALENFDVDDAEDVFGVGVDVDDSLGMNARLGLRFSSHMAMELVFEWFDEFEYDAAELGHIVETDGWAITYNFKVYPLTGRFQPYLLAGGGFLRAEVDDDLDFLTQEETELTGRVGAGIDLYTRENVLLNLEAAYFLPGSDLDDFEFLAIGLGVQYRF